MGRPGIVLYFDMLGPIRVLSDSEKGRLLVAMLEYGQSGTEPEFEGMLALAWGFVKPKLDRDAGLYEKAKDQRRYAAFCKQRTAKNLPKVSFEQWQEGQQDDNGSLRAVEFVASRYQSKAETETETIPETETISETVAVAETETELAAATAIESAVKSMGGALGRNKVFLSETQVESLLEQMELETFDYYVDKLAAFIEKNGARVKNHYETILKWYREDGRR